MNISISSKLLPKYLVAVVMTFFFFRNIYLQQKENLDSWMGGGMRMFGEIDKMLYRVSGFEIEYEDKIYFVNLRNFPEFEYEDQMVRILPSTQRMDQIMKKIHGFSWYYDEEKDQIRLNKEGIVPSISNRNIKSFLVYRIDFDQTSDSVNLTEVTSMSINE
jgi:hypothetical protein